MGDVVAVVQLRGKVGTLVTSESTNLKLLTCFAIRTLFMVFGLEGNYIFSVTRKALTSKSKLM